MLKVGLLKGSGYTLNFGLAWWSLVRDLHHTSRTSIYWWSAGPSAAGWPLKRGHQRLWSLVAPKWGMSLRDWWHWDTHHLQVMGSNTGSEGDRTDSHRGSHRSPAVLWLKFKTLKAALGSASVGFQKQLSELELVRESFMTGYFRFSPCHSSSCFLALRGEVLVGAVWARPLFPPTASLLPSSSSLTGLYLTGNKARLCFCMLCMFL